MMAGRRGVGLFSAFCESHESQVPFHVVARLLRAATGVEGLDAQAARDRVRSRVPDADPEDLALFDDSPEPQRQWTTRDTIPLPVQPQQQPEPIP
jgi:hypothetical protein